MDNEKEGENNMKLTTGEIVNNPILAFCKTKEIITVRRLTGAETSDIYGQYEDFCIEMDLVPER